MTARFIHNFDALVTTDYLDTRLSEFETRLVSQMDTRFLAMDAKFDKRFADVDARFEQQDAKFDMRLASFRLEMHSKFSELGSVVKVQSWMLGIIVVAVLYPFLQQLLTWG